MQGEVLIYASEKDGRFRAACAAGLMSPADAADSVGGMAARGDTIHTFRDPADYRAWLLTLEG
jgi:hypothetical protein